MTTSPCSVPDWLRALLPIETPAQQEACHRHDTRYAMGGERWERLRADLWFALDLLAAVEGGAMDADDAERYFWGVRQYGGGHWKGGDHAGVLPPRPPEIPEAP